MDPLVNKPESAVPCFSSFLPMCLLAISLVIILGWQITMSVQQYIATIRLADQQELLASQAAQTESKLQAMMTDLIQLAKTDPEAKAIVTKYRVKLNADKPSVTPPDAATPGEIPPPPAVETVVKPPMPAAPSVTN